MKTKYKLSRKWCEIYKNKIFLLPTIVVNGMDWLYTTKNFSIEFHFLCFHAKLLWMDANRVDLEKKLRKCWRIRGNEDAE